MSSLKAVNARGESGFTLIDMLFVIALIGCSRRWRFRV